MTFQASAGEAATKMEAVVTSSILRRIGSLLWAFEDVIPMGGAKVKTIKRTLFKDLLRHFLFCRNPVITVIVKVVNQNLLVLILIHKYHVELTSLVVLTQEELHITSVYSKLNSGLQAGDSENLLKMD